MSNSVERRLQAGEVLDYQGRPSRMAVLHRPVIGALIAFIVVGLSSGSSSDSSSSSSPNGLAVIASLFFFYAVYGIVRAVVFLKNAEYAVTDRRVVAKYGFIRQVTVDIFITHLAGAREEQTALGRMFNYGNVRLDGTGGRSVLVGLADPLAFKGAIDRRRDASRVEKGTAAYLEGGQETQTQLLSQLVQAVTPAAPAAVVAPAAPTTSRFCMKCGTGLVADARFCGSCGSAVPG